MDIAPKFKHPVLQKTITELNHHQLNKIKIIQTNLINMDGNRSILPSLDKLKEFEKSARLEGSGIEFDSIIGIWKFISIWKKDIDEEDPIFSSLLRVFSAKIEFKKDLLTKNSTELSVIASIQFGLFSIGFSGTGYLKGKQPLLPFCLNLIELKAGSNILLRRSLKEPEDKEKSFFAMIALEENDELLSARGQGGEVVIWLKD